MKGPVELQQSPVHNSPSDVDFSEYMWMADDLEEFDRKVEQELEQEFLEMCFEQMIEEEEKGMSFPPQEGGDQELANNMQNLTMQNLNSKNSEENNVATRIEYTSKLNPEAAEFVPRFAAAT